jgi:hypothetical protein
VAGVLATNGYVYINIDGRPQLAHRLAWLYVNGEWPPDQVDHIDRVRSNNRIANLRSASTSDNACNGVLRFSNTSGYRGVSWSKEKKKWVARIVKDRKQHVLGYFTSKETAFDRYRAAARNLHGEFSA